MKQIYLVRHAQSHIDARFTFEHACAIRNPEVLRLVFDGTSLRWDADFAVEALGSFATRVETKPVTRDART
ncbi:MAG TPA: hypothetical protein VJA26_10535 [Gammaproteobacteria bacterium]|nr:hypothetical protein [Gammaproteobacteria bacterium]